MGPVPVVQQPEHGNVPGQADHGRHRVDERLLPPALVS